MIEVVLGNSKRISEVLIKTDDKEKEYDNRSE